MERQTKEPPFTNADAQQACVGLETGQLVTDLGTTLIV